MEISVKTARSGAEMRAISSFSSFRPEHPVKTSGKVLAARGRATFLIVAVFLLSSKDLRAASSRTTPEYSGGSPLASESVVLPTSRDLVIPEAIDAHGNPIPEHVAHCLFTLGD